MKRLIEDAIDWVKFNLIPLVAVALAVIAFLLFWFVFELSLWSALLAAVASALLATGALFELWGWYSAWSFGRSLERLPKDLESVAEDVVSALERVHAEVLEKTLEELGEQRAAVREGLEQRIEDLERLLSDEYALADRDPDEVRGELVGLRFMRDEMKEYDLPDFLRSLATEDLRDGVDDTPSYDDSEEVRKAADLCSDESSRADGIAALREIIERHPRAANPLSLLAYWQCEGGEIQEVLEAEALLIAAFTRVEQKSEIATDLGSLYFFHRRGLRETIQWYLRSLFAQARTPRLWAPYLYLSEIYRDYGLEEPAEVLAARATAVRGAPASVDSTWRAQLADLRNRAGGEEEELLRQAWNVLRQDLESSREAATDRSGKADGTEQVSGSEEASDEGIAPCASCGGDFPLGLDDGSLTQCLSCETILCRACYLNASYTCPTCGAHEEADYV